MKSYLVTWVIRDGESEYDEEVVIEVKRKLNLDKLDRTTQKVLEAFYLRDRVKLSKVFDAWEFTDGDYRHIERIQFNEVTPEEVKVLEKYGIAYKMNI